MRILAVDDDDMHLSVLSLMLREIQFDDVTLAQTPAEALGRIAEARARRAREFDALAFRFDRAGTAQLRGWRDRLAALSRTHQTLGYTETLKRGYAVVRGDGHVVGSKAAAAAAEALEIEFADGRLAVGGAPGPAAKKASPKPPPPEQGSLF